MKPLYISEDIIPLGEFKTQAAKIIRQLHETGRPVVITQNGRPSAVLLTPEEFDRLIERDYFQTDHRATVRNQPVDDDALDAFAHKPPR
jgi:prevent-host-death family protein